MKTSLHLPTSILFILFLLAALSVSAQSQDTESSVANVKAIKKQKQKAEKEEKREKKKKIKTREDFLMEKTPGIVYVFGVSQGLGLDDVYITEINSIDSLALQKKTGFLPFRSSISVQLQRYTEGALGQTNQTVSIFYNTKQEKLRKTLNSVKKRYLSNTDKTVHTITTDQFYFIHPLDLLSQQESAE